MADNRQQLREMQATADLNTTTAKPPIEIDPLADLSRRELKVEVLLDAIRLAESQLAAVVAQQLQFDVAKRGDRLH